MKRKPKWTATFLSGTLLLLAVISPVLGQGGGRETPKPSSSKKPPAPKPTTPASRPSRTLRPQNPNIELVRIPPGSFMMGSANGSEESKPVHQVTISYEFYLGKYEVTQTQWRAVMGNSPSRFKGCNRCPVERVSWNDANEFIRKLNQLNDGYAYRLPTEAEWEYACRAGTTGDYAGKLSDMAWYDSDRTHAVGSKRPNAWGLADMQGNVWEWCEDWYHETYFGAPSDGSAWLSEKESRVLRGGSWALPADLSLPAVRYSYDPDGRYLDNGFRVAAVRTQ